MVPSSGRCEGAHKKVLRKTAPLLRIARSTHPYRMAYHGRVERGCKLLRGIWGIETCIYKTAGKSSSSPCSLRAASLEKLTGSFHCGNYTLECSYVEFPFLKKFSVYCILAERLDMSATATQEAMPLFMVHTHITVHYLLAKINEY